MKSSELSKNAAQQVAGADRLQRLGTWAIFIRVLPPTVVLAAWAAAQLGRCAAFSTA